MHIRGIVSSIFQQILDKTLNDGSCLVREFGKFISFKTFSTKIGQDVIRFKFKLSQSLDKRIKNDAFLLERAPIQAKKDFGDEEEERCKDKRVQKKYNVEAQREASNLGNEKTRENLMVDIVMDAIYEEEKKD